jgi:hypothetical protein
LNPTCWIFLALLIWLPHCIFYSLTCKTFNDLYILRKCGTWATRICIYGVTLLLSCPFIFPFSEMNSFTQATALKWKVDGYCSGD